MTIVAVLYIGLFTLAILNLSVNKSDRQIGLTCPSDISARQNLLHRCVQELEGSLRPVAYSGAAILSLNGAKNNPKIATKITTVRPRGGGLVRGPLGRTAVIFVAILGLFLAPFRAKIAATSEQMRFFGRKML